MKLMNLQKKAEASKANKNSGQLSPQEDRTATSSVNAVAALLSAAGIGTSLQGGKDTKILGGAMTGAGVTGGAAYHLARLLKAGRTARILATIGGATAGAGLGAWAGGKLDDYSSARPVHYVSLVNDAVPVVGDISTDVRGHIGASIPNTIYTKTKVSQDKDY